MVGRYVRTNGEIHKAVPQEGNWKRQVDLRQALDYCNRSGDDTEFMTTVVCGQ